MRVSISVRLGIDVWIPLGMVSAACFLPPSEGQASVPRQSEAEDDWILIRARAVPGGRGLCGSDSVGHGDPYYRTAGVRDPVRGGNEGGVGSFSNPANVECKSTSC